MRIRPLFAAPFAALLLSNSAAAAPPAAEPSAPPTAAPVKEAPAAPEETAPAAPGAQVQAPSGSNTQVQGPGTQSQKNAPPPPGYPGAPTIQVNPQIQVQVQPTIESTANPKADAKADADANADAEANPKADANAEVKNESSSESKQTPPSGGGVVVKQKESVPEPTTADPSGKKVIRIVVKHRSDAHFHHDHVDHHHRRGAGLLFGGVVSFGAGYTVAAINGGWLHERCDEAEDSDRCRRLARDLFIPVAGPFMGMKHVRTRKSQVKLGIMGGAQSLGVLMTLVGAGVAIHDARERRILNEHGIRVAKGVRLAPTASVDGAGLQLRARF
jgi:hypothetical protein